MANNNNNNFYTDEYRGYGTVSPTVCLPIGAEGYTISGIVIPYNKSADIGNGVFEVIRPGAVADILRTNPPIGAVIEHKAEYVLGSNKSGTLKLWDSTEGLRYSIALPSTRYAQDLVEVMQKNPGVFGASFYMRLQPKDFTISRLPSGNMLRTIHKIGQLIEITITAFPAYTATTANLGDLGELGEAVIPTGDGGARAKQMLQLLKIKERALLPL